MSFASFSANGEPKCAIRNKLTVAIPVKIPVEHHHLCPLDATAISGSRGNCMDVLNYVFAGSINLREECFVVCNSHTNGKTPGSPR